MDFVHLHLHTQYSLLDGAIRLNDLWPRAVELGYDAVSVTDHGNMYGALRFYQGAMKAKLKPIIGCEVYVAPKGREHKQKGHPPYHLVLLAKDEEGYKNLSRLVSLGFIEGFYMKPRIDKELLRRYSGGLIGLSACLSGEVSRYLKKGKTDLAFAAAKEYRDILGDGNFYLEIQKNGLPIQDTVNAEMANLSELSGIPLVATNDCHYLNQDDHRAHDILLCIQTGKQFDDPKRMRLDTDQLYFKSKEEMFEQFKDFPKALDATVEIARRCNVFIQTGKTLLPGFPAPEGKTTDEFLRELALAGLEERLEKTVARGEKISPKQEYLDRLDFEMKVISKMGFSDYFLIVWDFIRKARELGVPVGPGRGSGAGSVVAYAVGITQLDPLRFDLLFERFLNPERVSMPDFDIDFCQRKREKVIDYVTEFYGKDRVGQIVTYSSLNSKTAIRDVGRVLAIPYGEVDKISKLFPDGPAAAKTTIAKAIAGNSEVRAASEDPRYQDLFKVAQRLEKLNRQVGVHAAGVVISRDPLVDVLPLATGKNGEVITQYAKEELEDVGLVKFDFLGLKTLTVIDEALSLIKANGKEPPDLENVLLDFPDVYELISSGETTGIFQMESSGFRSLVRKLMPDRFEDIIAVLALYRPGPLGSGMVDQYILRKRGQAQVEYLHPDLEPILEDTYGVIIYQEQVMRIAVTIAGYSLGQADVLRKVMGKKKEELLVPLRVDFIEGGLKKGHDQGFLEGLFDTLAMFAQYGFNKSHSAAYAYISYWTALLKARYPVEFMAALMTLDKDKPDKMVNYLAECRRMRINVTVPDVNRSGVDFVADGEEVVFGMSGIRNVGEGAVEAIIQERQANGPFKDFFDFCMRLDMKRVNKRVVEWLINAGGFDSFKVLRRDLLADLERNLQLAQSAQKDKATGQKSLFGAISTPKKRVRKKTKGIGLEHIRGAFKGYMETQAMNLERDAIGFYLSAHPLDRYLGLLPTLCSHSSQDLCDAANNESVTIAGSAASLDERREKRSNKKWGRFNLEDRFGMVPVLAFSKCYDTGEEALKGYEPVLVKATVLVEVEGDSETRTLRAEEIIPLGVAARDSAHRVEVRLQESMIRKENLKVLRELMTKYKGPMPISFCISFPDAGNVTVDLGEEFQVDLDPDLLGAIAALAGNKNVRFGIRR